MLGTVEGLRQGSGRSKAGAFEVKSCAAMNGVSVGKVALGSSVDLKAGD